jgi:hypothetical protein
MIEDGDRITRIETRLGSIEEDVQVLKTDVGVLKTDVGGLRSEVHKLLLLYEHHDYQIQRIAEVQVQHGETLEEHGRLLREIKDGLAPMQDLRDFIERTSHDHEVRIVALEKHAGLS